MLYATPTDVSDDAQKYAQRYPQTEASQLSGTGLLAWKTLVVEIRDLGGRQCTLNRPIHFFLTTEEDGEMNAYYKPLEIYTFSNTLPEITSEIQMGILGLYEELLNTSDDQLGEYPRKWKAHLDEIISA